MKTVIIGLAGLFAALFVFLKVSERAFYNSFLRRSLEIRGESGKQADALVTEKDLEGLPEPAVRYLRSSGVIGNKRISSAHLKHSGSFKTGAGRPFLPVTGEYFITTKKPSFTWYGRLNMFPGVPVVAFDSYFNGKGRMLVKLLSAITVVDARSKETDHSAFGRCVAEMAMVPTFFLDRELIRWEQTGKDSVRCTVADAGFSTEAELYVNPDGSLDKTVVMRYFDRGGGKATLEKFTGRTSGCREHGGLRLPARLDGYWNLKEGDLHYVSFIIDSMEIE